MSTGGTIASAPGKDGRDISGALPGHLLTSKLQFGNQIDLTVESILQKPSNAITPDDWKMIGLRCQALIDQNQADGIVISHGTDTLEDTAYFLDCVLDTSRVPVIVTGSQRVPHALGSDAYANLKQAILAASTSACRNMGVMVAFNESLFSSSGVRKVSSFQLDGFDAPGWGRQGIIDQGVVSILQRPIRLPLLSFGNPIPDIDIFPVYAGASEKPLQSSVSRGAAGIIIDGVGRGHVPPHWMPVIREAIAKNMVVLVCSATLHGGTHQSYQFVGSLHDMENCGAIGVSHLSARKARIRLALLLAAGYSDPESIRQAFDWQAAQSSQSTR